jgi:hypothetical protein
LFIAFLLGALVLSPLLVQKTLGVLAPLAIRSQHDQASEGPGQIRNNPRYEPGGRNPLFTVFPIIGRGGLVNKKLDALHLLILLILGILIYVIRGRRTLDLPRGIWCLLWASLILFTVDWVSGLLLGSFLLYLPSRYTRVGLFLFLSIFVFLNIADAIDDATRLIRRKPQVVVWLITGVEIAAFGFILVYPSSRTVFRGVNMKWLLAPASLLLGILGGMSCRKSPMSASTTKPGQSALGRVLIGLAGMLALVGWAVYARAVSQDSILDPPPAERELIAFLETLPKDVMLAGTPCILDNVPLFAKRQILFSCEQISQDGDLVREALDTYYAEEAQAVVAFCRAHDVDYLVVDRQTYTGEYLDRGWVFFEPYNEELLPRVIDRDTFAVAHVSDDAKVFQSGDFFVVPCTRSALEEWSGCPYVPLANLR